MTQDERWQAQYDQMMAFMKENHRQSWGQASGYTQAPVPVTTGNFVTMTCPPDRMEKDQ